MSKNIALFLFVIINGQHSPHKSKKQIDRTTSNNKIRCGGAYHMVTVFSNKHWRRKLNSLLIRIEFIFMVVFGSSYVHLVSINVSPLSHEKIYNQLFLIDFCRKIERAIKTVNNWNVLILHFSFCLSRSIIDSQNIYINKVSNVLRSWW